MASNRSLGSLTLDLILKLAAFEQGFDKAGRISEARLKQIRKNAEIVGQGIRLAFVGAATAITGAVISSINSMDELSKAAQRAGVSTEVFSKLAYAADLADVSIQDLQSSFGRLAKSQAAALDASTDQAKIFKALGIEVQDATGNLRAGDEVLADFADRFQDLQGSPEILAAGMAIFGKSFQNLIPLIKDGSEGLKSAGDEAERFGKVISTEAGKQAEEFNDNLTRLKSIAQGVSNELAKNLLPDLVDLSEGFINSAENGNKLAETADKIASFVRVIATAVGYVAKLFNVVGTGLATVVAQAEALGKIATGDIAEGIRLYKEAAAGFDEAVSGGSTPSTATQPGARRAGSSRRGGAAMGGTGIGGATQADIDAYTKNLRDALGGDPDKPKKGGKSEAQKQAEQLRQEFDNLNDSLKEQIALYGQTSRESQIRYQLENSSLKELSNAEKQQLIAQAQYLDQLDKESEAYQRNLDLERERAAEARRAQEYIQEYISDMEFELKLMGLSNLERAKEIELRRAGTAATEEQRQAIIKNTEEIYRTQEQISLMDGFRDSFQNFFTDVIGGTESVSDAFKNMLDDINRMILQRISENWVNQLFGAMGSTQGGAAGGNWFSAFAGLFGAGKANGGWGAANSMFPVNERGFEMATVRGKDYMLTGNSPVQITPNHALSGGAINQVVNFVVQGRIDQRTQDQVAFDVGRQTQVAMRRNG